MTISFLPLEREDLEISFVQYDVLTFMSPIFFIIFSSFHYKAAPRIKSFLNIWCLVISLIARFINSTSFGLWNEHEMMISFVGEEWQKNSMIGAYLYSRIRQLFEEMIFVTSICFWINFCSIDFCLIRVLQQCFLFRIIEILLKASFLRSKWMSYS